MLVESYEAEQHLLHFGRSEEPACWMISGLISGYLTRTSGSEVRAVEDRCVARGDAACHLVARSRAEWDRDGVEDLRHFDSIKVVDIHVPALRDRRADVLALARVFLDESAARMNRTISGLSPAVADHLLRYDWPGNVRELENTMERAAALASSSRIEAEDLSEEIRAAAPAPSLGGAGSTLLEHVVKAHIMSTLDRNDGNQVHTARQLGIGSATLYRKLKSYGWSRHAGPAERLVDPEG